MNLRDYPNIKTRREALENEVSASFPHIGSYTSALEIASTKNCENMIGATQIPLGVAGPLKVQSSESGAKSYFLPLATTEGALVASISRGCKAIAEAGGAIVWTHRVGMTRGPVFYTGSIKEGTKLHTFIKDSFTEIAGITEGTSKHLKLKKITTKSLPNYTYVRFSYDTGDAMGMNMATIATQKAVEFIERETGIVCLSVAGNFDTDKKPAWINAIANRGMKAWAEIVLPKKVVADVLKTTPQKFFDVWLGKVMLGSAAAGAMGFNAHIANVLAAIFLATGQDPAHVIEGSLGITTAKVLENGDLYVGVFLPALLIGTVGGGTNLPTQKEALSILGVSGEGKKDEFAQIIVAACLAGEISLLASLSEGSLATAHERLGRAK
jgi:hydroxymethylglutaryl-CoA reductase (NADPH)